MDYVDCGGLALDSGPETCGVSKKIDLLQILVQSARA